MTRLAVGVEVGADGWCLAHVLALPGCYAKAAGFDDALAGLPGAVTRYMTWLKQHGEFAPFPRNAIELMLTERLETPSQVREGESSALFTFDEQPPTPVERSLRLRLMEHARTDLLATARSFPLVGLDWRPFPEVLSAREHLRHVAESEDQATHWLAAGVTEGAVEENEFARLRAVRQRTLVRVEGLSPKSWSQRAEWDGETWTLRKLLRRLIWHDLYHKEIMERLLAAYRQAGAE